MKMGTAAKKPAGPRVQMQRAYSNQTKIIARRRSTQPKPSFVPAEVGDHEDVIVDLQVPSPSGGFKGRKQNS